ncbi:DUF748 domain-containing protein [Pseudoteredinibacter isoporae]|uniref:DUF748 domain-containing protein n=1 Tax=Pseudoteredinibacter isoporae TaxID=570281 RepID=A0A7X0MV69_9GAMM|nr:DUF748 domain-containing protein [Pseudoteredinibacter isoporae]MBB6521058.1 hypothetical protein [Pseudoteredinibacter isoporae]NHO86622.1 DUF748 domain-containing protein [Pseudoteredinibacter isoporae]NIB24926.1 DUF748 domain-containing protein [Pseudoteredinibacter isoporae]
MKRAFQSFLIVLLCLILLIAGILASVELWLPAAVRKFSPDYMSGAQLDITELAIKWRKADLNLRGVQLKKDGKTQASIAGLAVDLRSQGLLSGLLDQTLIVDGIRIDNAKLTVEENQGQWGLRGLSLANANNTEQKDSPSTDSEAKTESKPWQVIINDARLEDIAVSVRSEQLDSDITIKSLTLDHFDSLGDTLKSEITLALNIDKTAAAINPKHKIVLAGGSNIDLKLAATGPLTTPDLKGQLQLENIAASLLQTEDNSEQALLSLGKIKLDNFNSAFLNKANSQAQGLFIEDLALLPEHDQGQKLQTLSIANIEHHPDGDNASLSLQGIHINGLHSQLTFLKDYKLGVQEELNRLLASIVPAENAPTPTQNESNKGTVKAEEKNGGSNDENKNALTITLEDIQLLNSGIHIRDDNYQPAVAIPIAIERFAVDQFNSGDKDSLSRWVLSANVDKQGLVNSEGAIKPLAENMALQAKLKLEHIKLVTFSPYIEKQTGYFIHTGQLSLDSQGQLDGKELQSKNQIDLRSIELERVSADKADQVDQSISMPLDSALGLLRDDNGDVRLELPVDGNIDSPEFGSGDILKQVSSRALREASVAYLKYAFQPYGTLISVGSWLSDQAQKIRLDSLAFDNGQTELSEQQKEYLQKLGELLQKKEQLRVRACPVISASEERWIEAQKTLQAQAQAQNSEAGNSEQAPSPDLADIKDANQLAEARTESLRRFMKARFDIGPERLLTCKTQTDEKSTESYIHLEI